MLTFSSRHVQRASGSKRWTFSYWGGGRYTSRVVLSSNTDNCVAIASKSNFGCLQKFQRRERSTWSSGPKFRRVPSSGTSSGSQKTSTFKLSFSFSSGRCLSVWRSRRRVAMSLELARKKHAILSFKGFFKGLAAHVPQWNNLGMRRDQSIKHIHCVFHIVEWRNYRQLSCLVLRITHHAPPATSERPSPVKKSPLLTGN